MSFPTISSSSFSNPLSGALSAIWRHAPSTRQIASALSAPFDFLRRNTVASRGIKYDLMSIGTPGNNGPRFLTPSQTPSFHSDRGSEDGFRSDEWPTLRFSDFSEISSDSVRDQTDPAAQRAARNASNRPDSADYPFFQNWSDAPSGKGARSRNASKAVDS